MTLVNLYEESQRRNGFYVPQFEVRIEGVGLPRDVLRDVVQCTYKDNIDEIDSFELTVNNWDVAVNNFKYVGAETQETLEGTGAESHRQRMFEPCRKEVQIKMGYVGHMRRVMTGTFTTMEPTFSNNAAPTLNVRGLNVLHQLRRRQYTTTWRNKKYSEIAEDISNRRSPDGARRFPLSIITDETAKNDEPEIPYLAQRNQYDLDFLLERARERGYILAVCETDEDRQLYFGPSQRAPGRRDAEFVLAWGRSLIDFKPTLTTANQVKSVTVRGWNRRNGRQISETVSLEDQRSLRRCRIPNEDLHRLLSGSCDRREEVTVDEPVFTVQQARQRACALLQERQKNMVKARGTVVGLPDLRAGGRVHIREVGARFNGIYFITKTEHTINDSGYTTRFEARREDQDSGEPSQ